MSGLPLYNNAKPRPKIGKVWRQLSLLTRCTILILSFMLLGTFFFSPFSSATPSTAAPHTEPIFPPSINAIVGNGKVLQHEIESLRVENQRLKELLALRKRMKHHRKVVDGEGHAEAQGLHQEDGEAFRRDVDQDHAPRGNSPLDAPGALHHKLPFEEPRQHEQRQHEQRQDEQRQHEQREHEQQQQAQHQEPQHQAQELEMRPHEPVAARPVGENSHLLKPVKEATEYGPRNAQQEAIVGAMKWAWKGYKENAWGHDELHPIAKTSSEWFHLGLTIVDSLDTLYIMGMKDEFNEAREWVRSGLNLDQDVEVNLFETTIRVLGGLLSAYHLSKDQVFLDRASDLGDRLSSAFNPRSKVPYSDVNLHTRAASKPKWGPDSTTSEVTTIQLEFKDLAHLTGRTQYATQMTEIMEHIRSLPRPDGLVPIFINADYGSFSGSTITLGARGDSYYEYLLKQWLQTGKTETMYRDMYVETVKGIRARLVKQTSGPLKMTYIAELINGQISPKMDHLVCFLPGALALGAANGLDAVDLDLAKELLSTCHEMYAQTATHLAPEIVHFHVPGDGMGDNTEMYIKPADAHNLLRPETAESLFILYRITKDPKYRDWGWDMFQAFERHCRVETGGYTSLNSVLVVPPPVRDKMESFFLAETLKYLFLLFAEDDVIPLDKYVINTEAHPLPIFNP